MPDPLWYAVRDRLWSTRKLSEARYRQLDARCAQLEHQLATIHESIQELASGTRQLIEFEAEVRTRTRRTQALTARAYEALQGWPALLAAAREQEAYDRAYEDPDPLVSVAISTYHSPSTLCERALASVLAQTYEKWEAIVVGDHCTDDTEERVRALGDERIRWHNLAVREHDSADPWERWAVKGSVPRAVGVGLSNGLWIAPLSHDDAWDADHLETLLAAARESRAEFIYSRMRVIDGNAPDLPPSRSCGAWPPQLGEIGCQSSIFNAALGFLRYDRVCALASEPNDWNLVRRAWEAGVRFRFVDRETSTLYQYPRHDDIAAELAAAGLPEAARAYP
jgi:hypothetical protein